MISLTSEKGERYLRLLVTVVVQSLSSQLPRNNRLLIQANKPKDREKKLARDRKVDLSSTSSWIRTSTGTVSFTPSMHDRRTAPRHDLNVAHNPSKKDVGCSRDQGNV